MTAIAFAQSRPPNAMLLAGSILCALLLLVCLTGQRLAPHDPLALDLSQQLAPPSVSHLCGTDQLGRAAASCRGCSAERGTH